MGAQVKELKEMEDYSDQMQEELTKYLIACSGESLNEKQVVTASAP